MGVLSHAVQSQTVEFIAAEHSREQKYKYFLKRGLLKNGLMHPLTQGDFKLL